MPAGHELATSRLSWLAIIPTCLAKIGILVPASRGLWLGREICEQGTLWRPPPRWPASLLLTVGCGSLELEQRQHEQ